MKYIMRNGALFSIANHKWVAFCKGMAAGDEVELPGKLLEFDLIEISKWDREDYAKTINIEVPSDLPTTKKLTTRKSTKTSGRVSSKRGKTT